VDPETFGSVLVKTTSHETSAVAETVTVVLLVDLVRGEAALLNVNVSAGLSTCPVHVNPEWSVNDSEPLSGAPCADVTCAESFGSHV
jgi:hypothetical protein